MSEHASKWYPAPEAFAKAAHVSGMAAYEKLVAEAQFTAMIADPPAA